MEDDALKKNTDCVYFLASPLTCKKGSDCEFRHSESARVNPRDCRYWLSGNCLNWDCPFRHPPLEGRPTIPAAPAPGPGGANKSRVPCYFFSQGFCAKGDKCPFMHGTPAVSNLKTSASLRPAKAKASPGSVPETNEKQSDLPASNGGEVKSAQVPTLETHAPAESRPAYVDGVQSNQKEVRTVSVSGATQNGGPRGRAEGPVASSGLVGSRLRLRQVQPGDERVQNGMEPDEWWEESSPGFDVLVDDGPEQSRYPDDPEFQSAGDTVLDSGKSAAGNRGRASRSMRMGDEIDQYDYDFPYDHPSNYEGGASYDHGCYEYNVHDQQGGYDLPNAYERTGHQRASAYSDRDEMLARERLGLSMDVDMRAGGGAHDQRSRIVKRRRPDGGQQHVSDSHSRRQRTEMPVEDYQYHQRQQEDEQKQHELHLRHQLFMQHSIRSNSRRGLEKTGLEPALMGRAIHDIGMSEVAAPGSERISQKSMAKGRSSNDNVRTGVKEVDIHSRLSKGVDAYGEAESRNFMDAEANRKVEREVKKDPSTFAGPKSLAQIRAEKRKGLVEDPAKHSEASNGLKKPLQANSQLKGLPLRNQLLQARSAVPDVVSLEALSVEDRKIKLDKVVTQELKKVPSFEGPKSLSAILKEKRKVESETETRSEETNVDQRLSPTVSRVMASRVEILSDVDSRMPEVDAEVGTGIGYPDTEDGEVGTGIGYPDTEDGEVGTGIGYPDVEDGEVGTGIGYPDVEDGEFLSDDEETHRARKDDNNEGQSHPVAAVTDHPQNVAARDKLWQKDDGEISLQRVQPGQGDEEEHVSVEDQSNGAGTERNRENLDYSEGHEYEGEPREEDVVEPEQDEDGYGLEDTEDEDDFAKKLGGFFS